MAIVGSNGKKNVSETFKKALEQAKVGEVVEVEIRKSLLYYLDSIGEIEPTIEIVATEDYQSKPTKRGKGRLYKNEMVKKVKIVKK